MRERNRVGPFVRLERSGRRFEPIRNPRLVSKSSLILSGKAAKNNFTAEPHGPTRLLGRIEPICSRSCVFNEALLRGSGQNDRPLLRWYDNANGRCLIAGVDGDSVDATASGRLSWLERGGRRLKPIRKVRGLSSNRALF